MTAKVTSDKLNDHISRLIQVLISIQEAKDEVELLKIDLTSEFGAEVSDVDGSKFFTLFSSFDEAAACIQHFIAKTKILCDLAEQQAVNIDRKDVFVKVEEANGEQLTEEAFEPIEPVVHVDLDIVKKEKRDSYENTSNENIISSSTVKEEIYSPTYQDETYPKEEEMFSLSENKLDERKPPNSRRNYENKMDERKPPNGKRNYAFPVEQGPFKCLSCGQECALRSQFLQHLKDKHAGEKFACTCCDKTFKYHKTLKIHMMRQQAKKTGVPLLVECKICKKQLNISYIHSHIQRAHTAGVKTVSCQVCGKILQESNVRQHMLLHKEANFHCGSCPKKFPTQDRLNRHVKCVHEKFRSVMCPICGKGFGSKSSLKIHANIHTGIRPYACHLCELAFFQKPHLTKHIKSVHEGIKQKNYKHKREDVMCNQCGKILFNKAVLKYHLENVHGIKQERDENKVDFRGKHFKQKREQKLNDEDPNQELICNICGKKFNTNQKLKKHEEIHAPNRPTYPCNLCDVVLSAPCNLRRHIKVVHEGDKRFSCEFCGKAFSSKNNVKEHMTMHTGEKFTCDICEKSFTQNSSLYAHKRRCHTQN